MDTSTVSVTSENIQETLDGSRAHVLDPDGYISLKFQLGPIKEHGVNGTTIEKVLGLVIDRLQGFQNGPFKCRENALAITKLEEALHWLHHRTANREKRGVEGTHGV